MNRPSIEWEAVIRAALELRANVAIAVINGNLFACANEHTVDVIREFDAALGDIVEPVVGETVEERHTRIKELLK